MPAILIEFDPKEASPLEVINTLNKILEQNLEEGKINDYSISMPTDEMDIDVLVLVAKEPKPTCPECESTELLTDYETKEVVCGKCGLVIRKAVKEETPK